MSKERVNSAQSGPYMVIDLVIEERHDGKYVATGGPREALFHGTGDSSDEAVGSWFRQNREAVNFLMSFVSDDGLHCSTQYGVSRSKEELGPNEKNMLDKLEQNNRTREQKQYANIKRLAERLLPSLLIDTRIGSEFSYRDAAAWAWDAAEAMQTESESRKSGLTNQDSV